MTKPGSRIREIRERKNWTLDDLANKTKISKGFLSDVENNKKNVSSLILLKIANTLGASVDFLLTGETKEKTESEPVLIPSALSQAAQKRNLSYSETLDLLNAHNSVIA